MSQRPNGIRYGLYIVGAGLVAAIVFGIIGALGAASLIRGL